MNRACTIYERPSIMNFVTFHRSEILTPILQPKTLLLNHTQPSTSSHPSLLGASLTSNIVLSSSPLIRSSLNIRLSFLASSPSNFNTGFGVRASRMKWLSQCGQYSSLSSNSCASFRKHFLHFLHANVISNFWRRG